MATFFNKLLDRGSSPACWGLARIKLIYKAGVASDLTNFSPIALTSVVGKLFHKIISFRLEDYLQKNDVINTSIQKGFISSVPGVFEHIYSLSAILQDSTSIRKPVMITYLNFEECLWLCPTSTSF